MFGAYVVSTKNLAFLAEYDEEEFEFVKGLEGGHHIVDCATRRDGNFYEGSAS